MTQGNEKVDELMRPVLDAIRRHVKDRDAITDIYNRAYEAVINSMDELNRWLQFANTTAMEMKHRAEAADVFSRQIIELESENAELKADLKNKNTRIAELEAEIDQLTAHDAAERQDDKWIPISENPTKSDWYLIMYQGYRVPDADYYDVEAGWLSDIPIPDYWMPMPEPPEVK